MPTTSKNLVPILTKFVSYSSTEHRRYPTLRTAETITMMLGLPPYPFTATWAHRYGSFNWTPSKQNDKASNSALFKPWRFNEQKQTYTSHIISSKIMYNELDRK